MMIRLVSPFDVKRLKLIVLVVSNLTTQRNAIRMLHERIVVLLQYVMAIINSQSIPS
jgi:hypothetical protein